MPTLKIYCFGAPRLELDEKPLAIERSKSLALLVYLAVNAQAHSRDALATLLWPDYGQSQAYAYLRRALWAIKDALGDGWLQAERESVRLELQAHVWVDVLQFRQLLRSGEQPDLSQAADLYRGGFLEGFSLRDSPAFDEWQFFQADSLRRELSECLAHLADAHLRRGEYEPAIQVARRWLALDTLEEAAHRLLMSLYAISGQRNAALRQYQECTRILREEVGAEPDAQTTALYEQIKSGKMPAASPRLKVAISQPAPPAPAQLPSQATPFLGRQEELAEIGAALADPACRLLSLVGPGGIGKTRLGLEAARLSLEAAPDIYPQGLYLVSLAPLSSPDSLIPAIAGALHFSFRSEDAITRVEVTQKPQLMDYLRDRRLLLLMDNFEHLVSGAGLLSELLAASPGLKILVTSRERLNLAEEWVFDVGGMRFPLQAGIKHLEGYSAVELFLQTARRIRLDFAPSEGDLQAIMRICRLVQGVPLAIELAAAWVKLLSCQEIAAEIQESLDFLSSPQRNLDERHRSLRAVFEHSWELLSVGEQEALMRLSVFKGDFLPEAGEFMLQASGKMPHAHSLSLLSALVDKSLLRRNPAGRYAMHELIKQYALEKLRGSSDAYHQARQQHLAYFAGFLSQAGQDLKGKRQIETLQRIGGDLEDVRQAWRWAVEQQDLAAIEQCLEALYLYYVILSRYQQSVEDLKPVVDMLEALRLERKQDVRLEILYASSSAMLGNSSAPLANYERSTELFRRSLDLAQSWPSSLDVPRATIFMLVGYGEVSEPSEQVYALYEQCAAIFRKAGDIWNVAMAEHTYGNYLQFAASDLSAARRHYEQSLAAFRSIGDPWGIAAALRQLAYLAYFQGDYAEVVHLTEESLSFLNALGNRWEVISCLMVLGQAAVAIGDYDQAVETYQQSMAIVKEVGARFYLAINQACLGHVYFLRREYQQAAEYFAESLEFSRENNDRHEMGMAYGNLGNVTRARGEYPLALQNYLESLALLEESGDRWAIGLTLKRLASLYHVMGDDVAAWEHYRRALQVDLQIQRTTEVLEVLVGMADMLSHQGQVEDAAQILGYCLAAPALPMDAREEGIHLLAEIEDALSLEILAQAQAAGRSKDFEQILALVNVSTTDDFPG